jgi:hypothetical protein
MIASPPTQPRTLVALAVASLLAACGGSGVEPVTSEPELADNGSVESLSIEHGERLDALAFTLPVLRAAPAAVAGTSFDCRNWRVGAVTVDSITVPAGLSCSLAGTIVRGSVQVQPGGILIASNIQVAGSVQGDLATHVQVTGAGTRVTGNIELEGGGSARLAGAQVGGDVFVDALSGIVSLRTLRVVGNIQVQDGTGGGEVIGNRATGNLQCQGNLPAPVAANNVAAAIEDQCRPNRGITPPPPPLAGNVTCVGLTIGAIRLDSVIVPAGASCTLLGTVLNGSVEVGAAARLVAENVNVTGGLTSDGAAALTVGGTSVFGGAVQVQRGAGATLSGVTVRGDLQIDAMAGPVVANGNALTGNLQVMDNRAGVQLQNNRMGGVMQCKGNLPAPTGSGNVATLKEDQCLRL